MSEAELVANAHLLDTRPETAQHAHFTNVDLALFAHHAGHHDIRLAE